MSRPPGQVYEFGSFILDPAECQVLDGGERLVIPPRVFDTLLVLVENSGRLVEKDALMHAVWPDTAVEENNLSQAISMARKVLRDGEDGQRFIETVPKRGYRFVAAVHAREALQRQPTAPSAPNMGAVAQQTQINTGPEMADATGSQQSKENASVIESAQSPTPARIPEAQREVAEAMSGPWKSRAWFGIAAVLVAAMAVLILLEFNRQRTQRLAPPASAAPIQSIAVLPLQNLSNDPSQGYFAEGMTDELITDLAQVSGLKVVSKTSIMQYKDTRKPLAQIGRELGVDAVIEGSVLRSGNRVRITAQLIRASTDRHVWANAYEGDLKDVLNLQGRVAEAITSAVRLNLNPEERHRFQFTPPVDAEAYDDYLRGQYHLDRRNAEGFEQAIGYFNRSLEKNPNFALAYAGLADCYTLLAFDGLTPGAQAKARAAAVKALALDDTLAEAHTSLAAINVLDWNWAGADQEFRRAIALNPNYALAHHWYGNLYFALLGRHEQAIAQLEQAQTLDPLSLIIRTDLGWAHEMAGQEAAALKQYHSVLAMDPNFVPVHFRLAQYYESKGMYEEWAKEYTGDPGVPRRFRQIYAARGYRGVQEAMAYWGDLREMGETRFRGTPSARAYCILGKKEQALADLEFAFQHHDINLIFLNVDHAWDPLRSDPQFQALQRKIGLLQP
jgi:TolB-like protein/DNA-binding winged helix-turn-helix (wHTH) protein/Flp pilus assembly protein TadD